MTADPSAAPGSAGRDAWDRMLTGWHVAFWAMVLVAAGYTVVSTDLSGQARARAGVLLAVLAAGYLVGVMRAGADARGSRGQGYLVLAILIVGLGCLVDPAYTMLLFIVFPQIWLFTSGLRWAVAACTGLTVATTVGVGANIGWGADLLRNFVPQMVVSLLFTILLGYWISRVVEQSRQRAELITQLELTRQELAEAHHSQGVTAERERMAREIHDTLAQGFTSIITLTQAVQAQLARGAAVPATVERLGMIESVARENLAEARALVVAFSPVDLDGATFVDAVTRLGERFAARTGTRVQVECRGRLAGIGRDREVVLLRAVQEALANVHRHARAGVVSVRVEADEDGAVGVQVVDDGVGFEPSRAEGYGLAGMRARLDDVGGRVEVDSVVGRGTRVEVHVPAGPQGRG